MLKLLKRGGDPARNAILIGSKVEQSGIGNCGEQSYVAFKYLMTQGAPGLLWTNTLAARDIPLHHGPANANERLAKLKSAYVDGTTHVVMPPGTRITWASHQSWVRGSTLLTLLDFPYQAFDFSMFGGFSAPFCRQLPSGGLLRLPARPGAVRQGRRCFGYPCFLLP